MFFFFFLQITKMDRYSLFSPPLTSTPKGISMKHYMSIPIQKLVHQFICIMLGKNKAVPKLSHVQSKVCAHTDIIINQIDFIYFLYCFLFKDVSYVSLIDVSKPLHTLCVSLGLFIVFCLEAASFFAAPLMYVAARVPCTPSQPWRRRRYPVQ